MKSGFLYALARLPAGAMRVYSRIGAGLLGRARYCLSNDLYTALKQLQSAFVSVRGKRDFYLKTIKKTDTKSNMGKMWIKCG